MAKKVYNLIILDRSGSMESIREATVAGINQTLDSIRKAADTGLTQLVTIMPFCGCSMDDICHNAPIGRVTNLTSADFRPCCMTPLYDAIGRACTRLRKEIDGDHDSAVSVTIITDGYENASREWDGHSVRSLIESLRAKGWMFAYIGANQDTAKVSFELSITNHMSFKANPADTKAMFARESKARTAWMGRIRNVDTPDGLAACNDNYFD